MKPRDRALPFSLGAAVVLLFFGALLAPGRALLVRDVPMFHLPLRLDWSQLARHGVPFWNPALHGGQPILSNPNYASFYPPTWLALVLPVHYAMGVIAVAHAVWAFAGAWLLARRLGCRASACALAAVGFVASTAFVATLNNFTLFCGLAWLPWVLGWGELALHGSDRAQRCRGIALTGIAIGAQILSGEPYSPTLGALALLCSTIGRGARDPGRFVSRFAAAVASIALGACLGAAQLLPTARHVADSPRSTGLAAEQTMTWSTRPERLIEWVFPRLHGDPTRVDRGLFFGASRHDRGSAYLPSIYVGQLVLVLALTAMLGAGARRRGVWIALVVVGIALALGRHNPLYAHLLVHLPPWSLLRYPEKFLLLATTGLTFAAALGWEELLAQRERGERRAATTAVRVAAGVVALAAGLLALPFVRPDLARALVAGGASGDPLTAGEAQRLGFLGLEAMVTLALGLVSLTLVLLHRSPRARGRWLAIAVLALVGLDLYRVGHGFVVTARAADLYTPPPGIASLPVPSARIWTDHLFFPEARPQPFDAVTAGSLPIAMVPARDLLFPYWGNLFGFAYALNEDYDLMMTSTARHALETFRDKTGLVERGWTELPMRYLGAWNACNLVRRRQPEALDAEYRRTGKPPQRARVVANEHCLDRFRFVAAARMHDDRDAATAAALEQGFDLSRLEHLLSRAGVKSNDDAIAAEASSPTRAYAEGGSLTGVEEHGARVDLAYEAPGPALLVAAMTWDRGWRAAVDGEPAPVIETAIGQMAVEVRAGSHRLSLRYRDPSVAAGVAMSLISLAAAIGLLRFSRRGSRVPSALPLPRA